MLSFKIKATGGRPALRDVNINRNPHGRAYDGWTCFYACQDYSTVGEVVEVDDGFEFIVESQHPDPIWGERVWLYSTSSYIQNEPWGRNPSNVFVRFRNLWFLASEFEPLQEWTEGAEYPKVDSRAWAGMRNGWFNFTPINDIIPERIIPERIIVDWPVVRWNFADDYYQTPTPKELKKIITEWSDYTKVENPSL